MPLKDLNLDLYNYAIHELNKENSWMEYHTGNIIKYKNLDIILHQANCFHTMLAGVARYLLDAYPIIGIEDKKTKYGDLNKLGHYTACLTDLPNDIIIFNIYSQFKPGSSKDLPDNDVDSASNRLKYLECALKSIADNIEIFNKYGDDYMNIKSSNHIGVHLGEVIKIDKKYIKIKLDDRRKKWTQKEMKIK